MAKDTPSYTIQQKKKKSHKAAKDPNSTARGFVTFAGSLGLRSPWPCQRWAPTSPPRGPRWNRPPRRKSTHAVHMGPLTMGPPTIWGTSHVAKYALGTALPSVWVSVIRSGAKRKRAQGSCGARPPPARMLAPPHRAYRKTAYLRCSGPFPVDFFL